MINRKISLCAAAFNEAEHLDHWVKQHREFVDEIVLADTGSFDNTVVVAKRLGIRVIKYTWEHSFSAAKNAVIDACQNHWIMMMSPDWWISKKDMQFIKHQMIWLGDQYMAPTAFTAYGYNHLTDWLGFYPGDTVSDDDHLHEFLFTKGAHYEGRVHEHCKNDFAKMNYKIIPLKIFRHHDSTADPVTENKAKKAYYDLLWKYNVKPMEEVELADQLRLKRYQEEYKILPTVTV